MIISWKHDFSNEDSTPEEFIDPKNYFMQHKNSQRQNPDG